MFQCPECRQKHVRVALAQGVFWICPGCGGRLGTIGLLRKVFDRPIVERYWWSARRRKPVGRPGRPCPACARSMREIDGPTGAGLPALDICKYCQLFWFDPGEFRALPEAERPAVEPEPHPAVQAVRAVREARREKVRVRPVERLNWQVAFAALALPIEIEAPVRRRVPVLTIAIGIVLVAGSFLAFFSDFEAVVRSFGFQAADPWRHGGLTLLTSFFLHGDPVHLLGNLYFLGLVGDNVEDFLGRWGFGLLLLASVLAASLLHMVLDPNPYRVAIGASGGVSGLIAFYACRFPRARLAGVAHVLPVRFSAWVGFLFWVVLQLALSLRQLGGAGVVSGLAHLGGAAAGVLFWAAEELYSRGLAALAAQWGRRSVASPSSPPGD